MIRSAVPPLDQVVCRIGTTFAAHMADAFVACDDRGGQLAPGLRAVGAVERIAALTLRWLPAARPVDWRLPRHEVRESKQPQPPLNGCYKRRDGR